MQQVRKEEKTSKGKVLLLQNNVTKDMVRNRREIGEDILLVEKEKIGSISGRSNKLYFKNRKENGKNKEYNTAVERYLHANNLATAFIHAILDEDNTVVQLICC